MYVWFAYCLQIRVSPSEVGRATSDAFNTTIGTPQGDCLSPVLFVIYLESALREVRNTQTAIHRPAADKGLPFELTYADDTDFVSSSREWLAALEPTLAKTLGEWNLKVNPDKTELCVLERSTDRVAEFWRTTKKLGSLLGDAEDVTRRRQLATATFRSLWSLWKRRDAVREKLRIRLYNAFVMPVLLYNGGTWGLTAAAESNLDAFHRQQLRSLLGIKWPQVISNSALYTRCNAQPVSSILKKYRWRLFGHVLRLPAAAPARLHMVKYFEESSKKWRGRPRCTLPTRLKDDLQKSGEGNLHTINDLMLLAAMAADRQKWRELVKRICHHPQT